MDLERLASNNPAMTFPASSHLPLRDRTATKGGRMVENRRGSSPSLSPVALQGSSNTHPKQSYEAPVDTKTSISKHERGWRRIVRNFSPSWFSTTMGTGIVSILFILIPFQHPTTYYLSVIFFLLNLTIFALAATISILRYTLYPEIWNVMVHDPTNSLFLGTIPMGFATLINAFIALCVPTWGSWATYLAFALWIPDAVTSILITLSLSFILMSQTHLQSLDRITAAQLLPIAATIVASGSGAQTTHALILYAGTPRLALATLLISYVMWGMSVPFALITLVIYYQRLTIHKLPARETIVSVFLPLGPLGMGGYTISILSAQARTLLQLVPPFLTHIPIAGEILYILGLMTALLMWSFGLAWFVYAVAAILINRGFPFNMGWWGFTFPLGVFAASTIQLGIEFPSLFFRVLGTIFAVMVILLWVVVAAGTVNGAWTGELFYAPCLRNLPGAREREREQEQEQGNEGDAGEEIEKSVSPRTRDEEEAIGTSDDADVAVPIRTGRGDAEVEKEKTRRKMANENV